MYYFFHFFIINTGAVRSFVRSVAEERNYLEVIMSILPVSRGFSC